MITIDEINNSDEVQYFDETEEVSYLAYDRYRCLRRIGDLAKSPLSSDDNVMVGYIRYECNLEIKTNTIYRRY